MTHLDIFVFTYDYDSLFTSFFSFFNSLKKIVQTFLTYESISHDSNSKWKHSISPQRCDSSDYYIPRETPRCLASFSAKEKKWKKRLSPQPAGGKHRWVVCDGGGADGPIPFYVAQWRRKKRHWKAFLESRCSVKSHGYTDLNLCQIENVKRCVRN